MSFTWKADRRLRSPGQVAAECLAVAEEMGLDEFAAVLAVMCIAQESDFWCPWNRKDPTSKNYPYDSESDDGRSVGYLQQQNKVPGENPTGPGENWWGTMESRMGLRSAVRKFFERLDDNYRQAINDPLRAALFVDNVQGSYWNGDPNHPGYYGKHWDRAWQLVRGAPTTEENPMAVSGDPVWLEDVLREALGDRLVVHDGWKDRGVGGVMGTIWGTMIHHTGNVNERVEVIRDGVDQGASGWLPGPLSQCLITPDGKCHLIAVGPCNHAGSGSYGTLTQGNRDCIGFECAYAGAGPWPQKQIITMRDATAAVSKKIGKKAVDSVCGHKEYAKPAGRKVDPGNMDMNWFRGEVQKDLDGFVFPGEGLTTIPPVVVPGPVLWIDPIKDYSDRRVLVEIWQQLRGIEGNGWAQLAGKTPVDYLELIGKRIDAIEKKLDS